MNDTDNVHLVAVYSPDGVLGRPTRHHWVAAVPKDEAVPAVLRAVPQGWTAELAEDRLDKETIARLALAPGQVSEFSAASRSSGVKNP